MLRFFALLLLIWPAHMGAQTRAPENQLEMQLSFAPVVRAATPAVVNIYAKRVVNVRSSPFKGDPFFDRMFRDFGAPQQRVENSLGSGVILSSDGIVVSNYHVVGQATDIRVVLTDRREFSARLLLADEESDLAILQVEADEALPALELRDSDSVEVGELVLAIGNPFGVGQTVSSGIVSGLARSGVAMGNARGYFIQTDAPINPGNSGGALVDMAGRLIGINTWILSRSGGSNGIGFAIPSALVDEFVTQARAGNDRFIRPWAGLNGQPVTADMAESLGLDRPGGIVISQVHPQSPFQDVGVEPGDVIAMVDGQPVNTPAEMIFRMSVAGMGDQARVSVLRNGKARDATVSLMPAPDKPARAEVETGKRSAIPGMRLSNINPAVVAEFGLPLNAVGVLVVDPGRLGARAGLRAGDVLRGINDEPASDTATATALLERKARWLSLDVQRGAKRSVLRFRL
ncbi:trypsin-like peptidase domain-containing protein [Roseovarius aestuarii]|uniref:Periplasmic serine endoprotease DegP n=1 Tax=Roseovarius aestuarii TaxID=475083 RepID=A0A1X7BMK9_9RHOB|nr:trypsin-like peptidase domain-containing protein [Roseovarius aestuarii]SMC10519.1 Periplasmic serine endoprotease DegP precursor [Roseovarius aestuarii]